MPSLSGNLCAVGIAYGVDLSTGTSVSMWRGQVTFEEALRHVADLRGMPEWGAGGRVLTDLTDLAATALPDRGQVSKLANTFRSLLDGRAKHARWAVVANAAFMRATLFAERVDEDVQSVIVFFDLPSACRWLGIEREALQGALASLRLEAQSQDEDRNI